VLSDQSRVFHVYSRGESIDLPRLKMILQDMGNHFLDLNGSHSVFVAFNEFPENRKEFTAQLEMKLKDCGICLETMYEYIDNEGLNALRSNVLGSSHGLELPFSEIAM
jgi:hypothetical protein